DVVVYARHIEADMIESTSTHTRNGFLRLREAKIPNTTCVGKAETAARDLEHLETADRVRPETRGARNFRNPRYFSSPCRLISSVRRCQNYRLISKQPEHVVFTP